MIKPHPLTNLEIRKYYENERRFNGVFSRDNLLKKIIGGAYVLNLDEHKDTGTHWIALLCMRNEVIYFDSFGVEHIPKEIKKFISDKNVKANIYRVQANDSIMCGYVCIAFIDVMLAGKTLIDYTIFFRLMILIRIITYRLYEIKRIENYFINEINEKESYSKKLNKYVTIFDYIDKILIVLSATTGGMSIISFTSIIGVSVGIVSASFTLNFSITLGINKKLLSATMKKKKKHDQIFMLAKSKYNSIEALIS